MGWDSTRVEREHPNGCQEGLCREYRGEYLGLLAVGGLPSVAVTKWVVEIVGNLCIVPLFPAPDQRDATLDKIDAPHGLGASATHQL